MKILFLDFDGVIFTLGGCIHQRIKSGKERRPKYELDPVSLSLIIRLLRDHKDLRIVVSSTWRIGESIEGLRRILGKEIGRRVIGKTPATRTGYRGTEIQMWINNNKHLKIDDIIILDDDSDMHPYMGYFFKTCSYNGFQSRDWNEIEFYLRMSDNQKIKYRLKKILRIAVRHGYYGWKYKIRSIKWRLAYRVRNYKDVFNRLIVSHNSTVLMNEHMVQLGRIKKIQF